MLEGYIQDMEQWKFVHYILKALWIIIMSIFLILKQKHMQL